MVLAGTPIGDVGDASPRLLAELVGADVIAAEDTRRLRRLLRSARGRDVGPGGVLLRGQRGRADRRSCSAGWPTGRRVVVVTDAGMPSVSDPGYRLVAAAVARGDRG